MSVKARLTHFAEVLRKTAADYKLPLVINQGKSSLSFFYTPPNQDPSPIFTVKLEQGGARLTAGTPIKHVFGTLENSRYLGEIAGRMKWAAEQYLLHTLPYALVTGSKHTWLHSPVDYCIEGPNGTGIFLKPYLDKRIPFKLDIEVLDGVRWQDQIMAKGTYRSKTWPKVGELEALLMEVATPEGAKKCKINIMGVELAKHLNKLGLEATFEQGTDCVTTEYIHFGLAEAALGQLKDITLSIPDNKEVTAALLQLHLNAVLTFKLEPKKDLVTNHTTDMESSLELE